MVVKWNLLNVGTFRNNMFWVGIKQDKNMETVRFIKTGLILILINDLWLNVVWKWVHVCYQTGLADRSMVKQNECSIAHNNVRPSHPGPHT